MRRMPLHFGMMGDGLFRVPAGQGVVRRLLLLILAAISIARLSSTYVERERAKLMVQLKEVRIENT